jgi:hypothetical protein
MSDIAIDQAFMKDFEDRLMPWFDSVDPDVDFEDRVFAIYIYGKATTVLQRLRTVQSARSRPVSPSARVRVLRGDLIQRREAGIRQLEPLWMRAYRRVLKKA